MAERNADAATLSTLSASIQSISSELWEACEHVGSAMREQLLRLRRALAGHDDVEAASVFESMRESSLVQGLASKFHDLRDGLSHLRDELAPWAKVIGGLVAALAGYFIFAEVSVVVAGVLVIGGFVYAILNALDVLSRKGLDGAR